MKQVNSREKCDKTLNVWKLERKKNEELTKGMNKQQQPDFWYTQYIHPLFMVVQSFNLGLAVPEKTPMKILMLENGKEEKWNKGTNKQQQPDSHCPRVYQVSIF